MIHQEELEFFRNYDFRRLGIRYFLRLLKLLWNKEPHGFHLIQIKYNEHLELTELTEDDNILARTLLENNEVNKNTNASYTGAIRNYFGAYASIYRINLSELKKFYDNKITEPEQFYFEFSSPAKSCSHSEPESS